ncbi:hypothetical protein DEO72_LG6g1284 [Vigna unguiculata]|uniref:Uncharacterized protein n=1 Tax=Vigna unguiculata TaxID=3917 RepID=A0A4D6M7T5_VIGUN|nr:hypothetical protein DEO72_LG6g1284 [Vigna unguiculata]
MENKDKGDVIEDSPLDMLLVILLEGASMEVSWLVTPSSSIHGNSGSFQSFDSGCVKVVASDIEVALGALQVRWLLWSD